MKSGCHLNQASMAQTRPKAMRKMPIPLRRQDDNAIVFADCVFIKSSLFGWHACSQPPSFYKQFVRYTGMVPVQFLEERIPTSFNSNYPMSEPFVSVHLLS